MREITGKTQIVGVFGWPVEHSLSPPMHNAAYQALGIDYAYVPFLVAPDSLQGAMQGLMALGVRGVNLTIPHKMNILPLLDEISVEARQVGAVNTVKIEDGRLLGYNTDLVGFTRAVTETGIELAGVRAVLFGAGGVGRAMGFGFAHAGASSLTIINRTVPRGNQLAADIAKAFPALKVASLATDQPEARAAVEQADVVANSTSVGMRPGDPAPVPCEWLRSAAFVFDTIYNRRTPLLEGAEAVGCRVLGGATMLVHQGARAIEIWTGRVPDVALMHRVLLAHL